MRGMATSWAGGGSSGTTLNFNTFDNYFVNNTDASKNFANIDASPRLSLNQFKDILIKDNGLSEAEYYAALGPSLGATREEQDTNLKAYYLDAVRDPNNLDAFGNPVVGIRATDPTVTSFVDNIINTEAEVIAAYKVEFGEDYVPTEEEIQKYLGATFSLDGDGAAVYDNQLSAIDDAFTSEQEITDIMRPLGYSMGVDSNGVYFRNSITSDKVYRDDLLDIIDPRKTFEENKTGYATYLQEQADALADIAADEQDRLGLEAAERATRLAAEEAARVAAAAELTAKTAEINAAMDDASQDGGAYSGDQYDAIRDYYLYNVNGKPQYDALNTEQRKALVQRAVDNRRYSESEIAADIRTAFPADADLSVEDLKTKYGTLFTNLQTEGTYGHEDRQRIAFDENTITQDEAIAELTLQGVDVTNFDFTDFVGVNPQSGLSGQVSTYITTQAQGIEELRAALTNAISQLGGDIDAVKNAAALALNISVEDLQAEIDANAEALSAVGLGESAYDIAVSNGFVGSQGDWLQSLIGAKGEKR